MMQHVATFFRFLETRLFFSEIDRPTFDAVETEQMQGCQMVCFQTKNPDLGKFWRVLLWKILVYFMTIWFHLQPSEILCGHLVYFVVIWYIFHGFGILDQEKSGNPEQMPRSKVAAPTG
jgi:hypothetical protein